MSTSKSFSNETSERYARAFFEISNENNEIDLVEESLKKFLNFYDSNIDYKNFIKNPTQSDENQMKVIQILSEKLNFSKNLKNFFSLLVEKKRIFFVKKICENILKFCSKSRGEIKAILISSKDLSSDEFSKINKEFSDSLGSTIKFDYSVDKDLIGGLKIQLGSFMIDTSIKNKLQKYKQEMLES